MKRLKVKKDLDLSECHFHFFMPSAKPKHDVFRTGLGFFILCEHQQYLHFSCAADSETHITLFCHAVVVDGTLLDLPLKQILALTGLCDKE